MMSADCLVLLSDIDGFYTAPPGNPGARLLAEVREITPEIEAMAGKPVSDMGSGGMITKLEAARIALPAGANMVIASGRVLNPLQQVGDGARAPGSSPRHRRSPPASAGSAARSCRWAGSSSMPARRWR